MAEAKHNLHSDAPIITAWSFKYSLQVMICLQYNILGLPIYKQGYVSLALGYGTLSSCKHQMNTIIHDRSLNCV